MPSIESPRLLLDQRFADMDEYGRQIGWGLDFRQLDPGRLRARAAVLAGPRCTSIRVEFNRAFHQAGSQPNGALTFGLPDPGVGGFRWCGVRARGGDILNFNLASGFEGTSGAGFSGYTLSFSEKALRDAMQVLGLDVDFRAMVSACSTWPDAQQLTMPLREQLTAAYHAAAAAPVFECAPANALFDFTAAAQILRFLSGEKGRQSPSARPLRRSAVLTVLQRIEEHDRFPLTIKELCRQTGVSAPSLYRGFVEQFGIGPKRYLHIRRLTGVRRELTSTAGHERIVDIANRWGFWHMGQFAADYRRQFDELPSETRLGAASRARLSSQGRPGR